MIFIPLFPRKRESSKNHEIRARRDWGLLSPVRAEKLMVRAFFGLVAFIFAVGVSAQVAPVVQPPAIRPAQTAIAHNAMVVAQEERAARIGTEILDRGGNAVD